MAINDSTPNNTSRLNAPVRAEQSYFSGFIGGILGGAALSMGLIGLVVGYSLRGVMAPVTVAGAGTQQVAAQPSAPADTPPAPAPAAMPPVDLASDHYLGDKNATVAVVEYSDFECPFCKVLYDEGEKKVRETYGNKVLWIYRHFPLSFHQNAQKEAEASECVAEQAGNDGFWKFHDYVFTKTTSNGLGFALDQLPVAAKAAGVSDIAKFQSCLDSGKYAQKVKDSEDAGIAAGVQGTPGNFVINLKTKKSQEVPGASPFESFKSAIEAVQK
jgi:protein-disulfide isomerase